MAQKQLPRSYRQHSHVIRRPVHVADVVRKLVFSQVAIRPHKALERLRSA